MRNALGFYVFNSTQNGWLQEDEKSWGSFTSAREYSEWSAAERQQKRTQGHEVTYVMEAS